MIADLYRAPSGQSDIELHQITLTIMKYDSCVNDEQYLNMQHIKDN